MSVDRLSVTVPSRLGSAMRALARSRGQPVSTFVTDAIAHQLRMAALDEALATADALFDPVAPEQTSEAERELLRVSRGGRVKRRRARR